MARVRAITAALARAVIREQRHLRGLASNNLFWLFYLLGASGAFLLLLVGLVVLAPMCGDPFRRLPVERAGTWPVTAGQLRAVRLLSVALSPAVWVAAGAMAWTGRAPWLLLVLGAALFTIPFPKALAFRAVPGLFGELVRKNVRELLSLLDPYIALLVAGATVAYRLSGRPLAPEALPVMAVVVVVILSTCAQALFALDAGPGMDRYRLMPLRGWKILGAKHAALGMVALPLVVGLDLVAGITALLAAMAFGNHFAVTEPQLQARWSLTAGALFPGLAQCVLSAAAGMQAAREAGGWIVPCAAVAYVASTAFYGWRLERGAL